MKKMYLIVVLIVLLLVVGCTKDISNKDEINQLDQLTDQEFAAVVEDKNEPALAGKADQSPKLTFSCVDEGKQITLKKGDWKRSLPKYFCNINSSSTRICTESGFTSKSIGCKSGCNEKTGQCNILDMPVCSLSSNKLIGNLQTTFVLSIKTDGLAQNPIVNINHNGDTIQQVELFDDGEHYDQENGDGIYAASWQSINVGNLEIMASDKSCTSNNINIQIEDSICESFPGFVNDEEADRINIVLIPNGYDDINNFNTLAEEILTIDGNPHMELGEDLCEPPFVCPQENNVSFGLFSIEPFRSNKEKFNVWVLPIDLDSNNYILLKNQFGADKLDDPFYFDYCNFDFPMPIFISNSKISPRGAQGSLPSGSTNNQDPQKQSLVFGPSLTMDRTLYPGQLFTHEFLHSFAGLADEYGENAPDFLGQEEEFTGEARYPNCAPDIETAEQWWEELIGEVDPFFNDVISIYEENQIDIVLHEEDVRVGYFEGGCKAQPGEGILIRPTNTSIMKRLSVPVLGSVNRQRVENLLSLFSGE